MSVGRSGASAIGALLAALVGPLLPPTGLALFAAAVGVLLAMLPRVRGLALPAALGALAVTTRLVVAGSAPPPPAVPEGGGPWTGVVESVFAARDGAQSAIVAIGPSGVGVAVTLPRYPIVEPAQTITFDGALRAPPDGGYGDYLRRIGVVATGRSRSLEVAAVPPGPARLLESTRRAAGEALARALPEPEAGLAAGIVIGLRDRVARDVAADFTTTGVSHVVAISGWNIAIVAGVVAALAGRFGRRRRAAVTVGAILGYVLFAGASASVVRAAAMAGVTLLARETGRAGRAAAALGWAVTLLLVADPALVADAGFQLSSLATAGLLAWGSSFETRLRAVGGGRLPGWLAASLGVSFAAQLATLPVVLLSFGRLALVAPAVNLVIAPIVAPAMAGAGLALVAGLLGGAGLPSAVVAILALPGWLGLTAMVALVRVAAAVPFASVTLSPSAAALASGATVAAIAASLLGRRAFRVARTAASAATTAGHGARRPIAARRAFRPGFVATAATLVLVVSVGAAGLAVIHHPDGVTRVTVLDVGQGDAILVEGSRGGRLLVDGGPDPDRLLRVLDARLPPWDRQIDVVILSHPHEDHVAGLPLLLDRYRVGRVFEPGMRGPGPGYRAWEAILGRSIPHATLATGDRLRLDDAALRVLWPDRGTVPAEPPDTGTGINNVSIVLLGEVAGRRFLLTGDVEQGVDPALLDRVPSVDLLKVAHHGSGTASTGTLLDRLHPSVAVVSAGADNPYGHPARSTLARLRDEGATVYRTDQDGSVEIAVRDDGLHVRTDGRAAAAGGDETRRVASADARPGALARAPAFSCGIPAPPAADPPGDARTLLYHRVDVRPLARGRRRAAPAPRSPGLARPPCRGRRRRRGLARGPCGAGGSAGRPPARGGGGAPPRRRQAAGG